MTDKGNGADGICVFPFTYAGVQYKQCATPQTYVPCRAVHSRWHHKQPSRPTSHVGCYPLGARTRPWRALAMRAHSHTRSMATHDAKREAAGVFHTDYIVCVFVRVRVRVRVYARAVGVPAGVCLRMLHATRYGGAGWCAFDSTYRSNRWVRCQRATIATPRPVVSHKAPCRWPCGASKRTQSPMCCTACLFARILHAAVHRPLTRWVACLRCASLPGVLHAAVRRALQEPPMSVVRHHDKRCTNAAHESEGEGSSRGGG